MDVNDGIRNYKNKALHVLPTKQLQYYYFKLNTHKIVNRQVIYSISLKVKKYQYAGTYDTPESRFVYNIFFTDYDTFL